MQSGRLFEIIYFLLNKSNVTANELAGHFGVSRRTICRDIDTLSAAGIPVYTERGKGGGIRLLPDFVLNKSILSEREQAEILSSLQALSNVRADDSSQILRKLSAVFNKPITNWMEVDFSDWHCEASFFDDLKTAILERRIVRFDYFNNHGEKTFRSVEPMQLWFKSKSWYLKAFCLTRQSMRLYKLLRIQNLTVTDEHFSERGSLNVSGIPDSNYGELVTFKLRISPEMTYRVYEDFPESTVEKQPDGSFIATVSMPESNWVYGFLLSYRKYIEVLEPEHIRTTIKKEAQEIAEKYL